jgi:hypothetical protein
VCFVMCLCLCLCVVWRVCGGVFLSLWFWIWSFRLLECWLSVFEGVYLHTIMRGDVKDHGEGKMGGWFEICFMFL